MREIKLTNTKKYTIVDDEDYPLLSRYSWRIDPKGYAVTGFCGTTLRIHRFILNPPKDKQIDHINNDKLDNRKTNLRLASNTQNQQNIPKTKRKTSSRYKGVHWRKDIQKWSSRITIDGKRTHLGYYDSEEKAARMYNAWAKDYFGEFAKLNQIEGE